MKKIMHFSLIALFLTVMLTGCGTVSGIPDPKTFTSDADGEIEILSIDYDLKEVGLKNDNGKYWYLTTKNDPENCFTVIELDLKNTQSDRIFNFDDVVLKNDTLTVKPMRSKYQQGPFVCEMSEFNGSSKLLIPADPEDGYSVYLIYLNPIGARFDVLDYRGKEIKIINPVEEK